jgi:putative heme-binding domain-containing protein
MLHLIPGGDYGYRFRNGRRGIHPFTAWDGELPGTLPMVAGTGEAPSGIVAYESDAFPNEYRGSLLATSWGDHRIDRFRVHPQGTSVTSKAEPIIVGGENFRPVGVALAPDGSLFATDWVLRDYKVHGRGRIWRIAPKMVPPRKVDDLAAVSRLPLPELRRRLESPRMDVRRLAARTLAERDRPFLEAVAHGQQAAPRPRLEANWALARQSERVAASTPPHSSLKNAEMPLLWPDLDRATAADRGGNLLLDRLKHPSPLNPSIELLRLVTRFDKTIAQEPAFLEKVANLDDRFVFAAVVQALTNRWRPGEFADRLRPERTPSPRVRLALLLAARQSEHDKSSDPILVAALRDPDFTVRRTAVQWIGEERLPQFRTQIEHQLSDPTTTSDLFEAALASLEMLDGHKRTSKDEFSGADYALRLARDERAVANVRALALRMVPPGHKGLDAAFLRHLLASSSPAIRFEAVRTLRETAFAETPKILRSLAADAHAETRLRLEAIAGLAAVLQGDDHDPATIGTLRRLLTGSDHGLQIAALRALRRSLGNPEVRADVTALASGLDGTHAASDDSRELAEQLALALRTAGLTVPKEVDAMILRRPRATEDWIRLASSGGNAEAGRRLFEHPNAGGCFRCHTINGRGGKIGPDLSVIARSTNREKLAESILRPSKEIAPQFTVWTFVTREGRTIVGMVVAEDREGRIRIGTPEGVVTELASADVEERHPQNTSLMPERLVDTLTPGEFCDLIAYLGSLK